MGAQCKPCISNRKPINKINIDHSNFPEDLATYECQVRQNLGKIKFNGLLYNIRIINLPRVKYLFYFRMQFQ